MCYERFKVIHAYSLMNTDMDYYILLDVDNTFLSAAQMAIRNAENEWWDNEDGIADGYVMSEYMCLRLEEQGFNVYGYFTNETHEEDNEYSYINWKGRKGE